MAMTLSEITAWLRDKQGRPAPPRKVAVELDNCSTTDAPMLEVRDLIKALEARFMSEQRKQLTDTQVTALYEVLPLATMRGPTRAFRRLSGTSVCLEILARVIHPGLVNQNNTLLNETAPAR